MVKTNKNMAIIKLRIVNTKKPSPNKYINQKEDPTQKRKLLEVHIF